MTIVALTRTGKWKENSYTSNYVLINSSFHNFIFSQPLFWKIGGTILLERYYIRIFLHQKCDYICIDENWLVKRKYLPLCVDKFFFKLFSFHSKAFFVKVAVVWIGLSHLFFVKKIWKILFSDKSNKIVKIIKHNRFLKVVILT